MGARDPPRAPPSLLSKPTHMLPQFCFEAVCPRQCLLPVPGTRENSTQRGQGFISLGVNRGNIVLKPLNQVSPTLQTVLRGEPGTCRPSLPVVPGKLGGFRAFLGTRAGQPGRHLHSVTLCRQFQCPCPILAKDKRLSVEGDGDGDGVANSAWLKAESPYPRNPLRPRETRTVGHPGEEPGQCPNEEVS